MCRKILKIIIVILASIVLVLIFTDFKINSDAKVYKVNLTSLTYEKNKNISSLPTYIQANFNKFLNDYKENKLPDVYVTEFLFDGVGMYKAYDLDDFMENGNDIEVKALKIVVLNINTSGNIELTGKIKDAMVAVNTNNIKGDINIILNEVNIDTDSKKVPAIYVYNKDRNYTNAKVTISSVEDTNNYLTGGKLKKISLIPKDNLDSYSNKYKDINKINYKKYNNYYGIYTKEEIKNILFATVTADNEDLNEGEPYYYYKASGVVSSDIDLTFKGKGYLEITSKNKDGVETKGNLTFTGGNGDYLINAKDDCLNTTTDNKELNNARNTLTIDVNSLYAIVSPNADEGDAIDSNGKLIINGGKIVALSKTGQDALLDSEKGTYINGGTVIATGDMFDEINANSKQNFISLTFNIKVSQDELITLLDSDDNFIFAYKTDRSYNSLLYSSSKLSKGIYNLYKEGTIDGNSSYGLYTEVNDYSKGDQLAYSNNMLPERPNNKINQKDFKQNNVPFIDINEIKTVSNKDFKIEGTSNYFNDIALYKK